MEIVLLYVIGRPEFLGLYAFLMMSQPQVADTVARLIPPFVKVKRLASPLQ